MEFFLPSLFVFLLTIIVAFAIIPNFSPTILVIFALVLLVAGTYYHITMFKTEYELSTWQEKLKLFGPGIVIVITIIFMLFSIYSFFSGGEVPVPAIPTPPKENANTATNILTKSLNNAGEMLGDVTESIKETATNIINTATNNKNTNKNKNKENQKEKTNKANEYLNNGLRRSFLEVL
jgi:hypothetical protein